MALARHPPVARVVGLRGASAPPLTCSYRTEYSWDLLRLAVCSVPPADSLHAVLARSQRHAPEPHILLFKRAKEA